MPDNFGFFQPITLSLVVPDGSPEYKAGWYGGCKTSLATGGFLNASIHQTEAGPDFGSGVYQHDPQFQTGWGQGYYACQTHTFGFVNYHSMKHAPLE